MKPIDFLFFIDHPVRELDAMTAVGRLLSKAGFTWDLVPLRADQWPIMDRWHPRVACFTWFYFREDRGFDRCLRHWPGTLYANLAFEQSVHKINRRLKAPKNPYVLSEVWHSCWSRAYQEELVEKGVPLEKTRVNGSPVLALYQAPYRELYPNREAIARMIHERHGRSPDPSKRWILIPENYNAAFYDQVKVEEYVEAGEDRAEVEDYIRWAEESLFALADWLSVVPDQTEVILRPRPGVGKGPFLEKLGSRVDGFSPRVHVLDDLTVREWVLQSDGVASSFSTTMIESAAAGTPTYMLAPLEFPPYVMNDWYELTAQVPSQADFNAMLNGSLSGDPGRLGNWAKASLMPSGDPIQALAGWLIELRRHAEERDSFVDPLIDLERKARSGIRSLKRVFGRKSWVPPQDAFSPEDVARRSEDWKRILA
jgi:surface carbohydrate biosynthesis protein